MKRLVVNADDFGLCRGVNLGILRAYREGIVRSTTLLVNGSAAEEAYALARATPGLGVGIHITLTSGRPLATGGDSLVGPEGNFLKMPELLEYARPEQVRREISAQVQAFLASGLTPTHLDSHHHIHRYLPAAAEAMEAEAAGLGIPLREISNGFTDAFYGSNAISVDHLLDLLARLPDSLFEIMTHPAQVDEDLLRLTSYARERATELATLTDPRVLEYVASHDITLVNYRDEQRRLVHG
ncbi:MAG: ChbG/HpnK family deacetylase [Bacillota bacterium]